jgi:hypothetical protein
VLSIIQRAGLAPCRWCPLNSHVRPHQHTPSMPTQVFSFRPPTPEELDTLATVSAVSFILGALAFLCVLIAACIVAVKTRLPGRYGVLLSLALLASWWLFEKAMKMLAQ